MMPTYTFFAVDKGNMTLIQFPDGVSFLVDCRQSPSRPSPLAYLQSKGVQSLDFVVVTHPHRDHLTGLQEVCEAFRPKYLWHNGRYFKPDPVYDDWLFYERLRTGKVPYCSPVRVQAGQTATIGSARLFLAGPPDPYLEGTSDDENNNGIVVSIVSGYSKVVLTGDTQQEQWEVTQMEVLADPSVFLASHHGRESGFSESTMTTLNPQHIVISDGVAAETDATGKYKQIAPVSTTRNNSVVVQPK